jgi:hypothetical protein
MHMYSGFDADTSLDTAAVVAERGYDTGSIGDPRAG